MAVGYSHNKFVLKLMMALDKFSCKQSDLVITVGRDLVETLKNRFQPGKAPNVTMINNWIDEKQIYPLPADEPHVMAFKRKYHLQNKFIVMYSGNIGLYYDLENLIKVIEKFPAGTKAADGRELEFVFVGAGTMLPKLKGYVAEHGLENICFIPYQPKATLIYSLNAADVHWCVNAKGIKGVSCPSKFYGIAAAGKPVFGVLEEGSEIRLLIQGNTGGYLSDPGDYATLRKNITVALQNPNILKRMGENNRRKIERSLTRKESISKYRERINQL